MDKDIENELLCRYTEHYFTVHAPHLGNVRVSAEHETNISVCKEENELETAISFIDENVEPYIYCIDQNEFGITYHRFTKKTITALLVEPIHELQTAA